jgi:hypothetical protein
LEEENSIEEEDEEQEDEIDDKRYDSQMPLNEEDLQD